jgi:GNAT superfamily N-acetyltransferase
MARRGRILRIALLADHAAQIDDLVARYRAEWAPYYGDAGPGDARRDLESRCNRDSLPIGLVAFDGDRVVGTVALDRDAATGLTPSVVGLLVAPEARRQGVAGSLIESAERLARELGYDQLFISTSVLQDPLRRRGWQEKGDVEFLNTESGKVFVRNLGASESA